MKKDKGKRIRDKFRIRFYPLSFILLPLVVSFILCAAPDAHAAQLLISIAGGGLGFLIGGPMGASLGFMAGGLLGSLLFPQKMPTIYGPRMEDKSVQSAAFGAHITWHWGMDRLPAQVIFSSDLKETKHKTEVGGKGLGGGSQTSVSFTYAVDIMLAFSRRGKRVLQLYADTKLIYDVTDQNGDLTDLEKKWQRQGRKFVVRDGNESQLPSALEESYHGECSAHRSLFCIEFEDFQLADFGNRIPNFTAVVDTEGENGFGYIGSYTAPDPPYSWWLASWGYMDDFGEIVALYAPFSTQYWYPGYSHIFHWTLATPDDPAEEFHTLWQGFYVQSASIHARIALRSDEHSALVYGTGGPVTYFRLLAGDHVALEGDTHPNMAVKYGDDLHTIEGVLLRRYNALSGVFISDSNVLADHDSGFKDMGRTANYLWILMSTEILKLDPVTMDVISIIDISAVGSTVLAMAVVSDNDQRVATANAGGVSFWKIEDGGAPVLDGNDPDQSYAGVRGFGPWGLRLLNDVYVLDFAGAWGGFPATIDFYGMRAPAPEGVPLWKIVRDISLMEGIDTVITPTPPSVGDIRVGELVDVVHGYSITRSMSGRDAMVQLRQAYFFDARETDAKLDFVKRGKPAVKTIAGSELAVRSSLSETLPDRLTATVARETELPIRIHVVYNNHEFSYQPGHEYAPRLITDARKTITVQIAVAINSTQALQIADTHLAVEHLQRDSFSARASRRHMQIDAADNVEIVITESE
jgi:hypothetical protein